MTPNALAERRAATAQAKDDAASGASARAKSSSKPLRGSS